MMHDYFVVARTAPNTMSANGGDKFADIAVGAVGADGGAFKATHMLLVQLKRYSKSERSTFREWAEMRKMGCKQRLAVIAGCVVRLKETSWDEAMSPLNDNADNCRERFDEAREEFYATKENEGSMHRLTPTQENEVFEELCGRAR